MYVNLLTADRGCLHCRDRPGPPCRSPRHVPVCHHGGYRDDHPRNGQSRSRYRWTAGGLRDCGSSGTGPSHKSKSDSDSESEPQSVTVSATGRPQAWLRLTRNSDPGAASGPRPRLLIRSIIICQDHDQDWHHHLKHWQAPHCAQAARARPAGPAAPA